MKKKMEDQDQQIDVRIAAIEPIDYLLKSRVETDGFYHSNKKNDLSI